MKNRTHYSELDCSVYKALFDFKANLILINYLPVDTLSGIKSDDLFV